MSSAMFWWPRRGPGDRELDGLVSKLFEDGARAVASELDLEAGQAALLAGEPWRLGAVGPLELVLLDIEELLARISVQLAASVTDTQVVASLVMSRQLLMQLRAGLSGRTLNRDEAGQLILRVCHALRQAELSVQHDGPAQARPGEAGGAEVLVSMRDALPGLLKRVDRLFDEADESAALAPVG